MPFEVPWKKPEGSQVSQRHEDAGEKVPKKRGVKKTQVKCSVNWGNAIFFIVPPPPQLAEGQGQV